MTTTTPSSEPAVVFELTGDTVTITADGLRLTHTINTASTDPATPLPLADVAEVASASKNGVYTPANRFFPGTVDLGVALPKARVMPCLLYTSPSPRDGLLSRMPSSA